jgi:hypothetical protein
MKTTVSWVLAGILGLSACSKEAPLSTASDKTPVVPAVVAPAEPSDAPPTPAVNVGVTDEGGNIPGVEMINSAIGDFAAANGRAPKNLNELVVAKYLQKVPPAPPGKKYDIDPVKRQVKLVNL